MRSGRLFALLNRPRETVSGATAVEYGVVAVAVCAVVAAVVFFFGQDITSTFSDLRMTITSGR